MVLFYSRIISLPALPVEKSRETATEKKIMQIVKISLFVNILTGQLA